MTISSGILPDRAGSDIAPLRAKWGWVVALGVVYLITGFVALGSVVLATVASVLVVGVMMIIAGVAEVVNAFQLKSWSRFLLWALLGLLYIVAGFMAFENPVFAAVVLTLVHARHRPVRGRRTDLSRRSLLRLGMLASTAGILDAGVRAAGARAVPRGIRRPTGSFRLASSSVAAIPATSWLFDRVPAIDALSWRLTVTAGGVSREWSLAELGRWDDRLTAVLDCTGGWWTEQEWSGVRLARLLPQTPRGSVEVTSATGYSRRLPLTADLLLATAVGGVPLSAVHGSPARLVVPGRRGYHWVKWVARISLDDRPWWAQPPLPLQ